LLDPGMDAVIGCLKRERTKPPTGMKNDCAGWQRESWNASEHNAGEN